MEAATAYQVPHGIGVALGIAFANRVSLNRACLTADDHNLMSVALRRLLKAYRVPAIDGEEVLFHLRRDKKRTGRALAMILTRGVGKTFKSTDVTTDEYRRAFRDLSREGWW